ncbi:putative 26S proteasome regulatory subunit 7 [Cryptosporidium serpentis]
MVVKPNSKTLIGKDHNEDQPKPLDQADIDIMRKYGLGPYVTQIRQIEVEVKDLVQSISKLNSVRESDTGLAPPPQWDLAADRQMMQMEQPLQVARCTKIIDPGTEEAKYVINIKQMAKYVVGLGDKVAPTDIEEGMRVGVDRNKYKIQIPLPPKIDPSVAMMTVEDKPDVTYNDIGGAKEQLERLREVVEMPLLHPERFVQLGIDPPKGVLLYGPPGTGKTLTARAVANRTDACFICVIGSELVQKYVGEGARMVRELFRLARSKKACILFIDEVDAIGGARGEESAHGDHEVQRTMLEIVNQLDGFDARGNIKVLMATNRPDTLDPALLRPGRLDRKVEFSLPDLEGRTQIFMIHARVMNMERDIRFELLARLCPNCTGADIRSVCTEAGMFAIRARRKSISEKDLLEAINKVVRGYKKFSATPKYMVYN